MENSGNRILDEISAWNQKVNDLKGVFGNHITDYQYLIRAKLGYFKEIKAKYNKLTNQDEKIASKILQAEIQRLEKIAFPNRIARLMRKTIENARYIIKKISRNGRSGQQELTENEFSKKEKSDDLAKHETTLNKTAIEYNRKLKAVKGDTLLPKLRNSNGKGLKMQ